MPRFTASAPNPAVLAGRIARYRCVTVADCDRELRSLHARLVRTDHPVMVERIRGDMDVVLDHRTKLAFDEAIRLAREP
jgi:hypothetical protein